MRQINPKLIRQIYPPVHFLNGTTWLPANVNVSINGGGVFLIQNPNSISQCSNILFGRFFKLLAETSLFVIFNYIGMNGGAVKAKFLYIGTHFN